MSSGLKQVNGEIRGHLNFSREIQLIQLRVLGPDVVSVVGPSPV